MAGLLGAKCAPSPTVRQPIEVAPAHVIFQRVTDPSHKLFLPDADSHLGPELEVSDKVLLAALKRLRGE